MGRLVFGMLQSLGGYVDGPAGGGWHCLHRGLHSAVTSSIRSAAWLAQQKWVVSRTLKSVGPNATLVAENVDAFVRRLKEDVDGEIDVAGPTLAGSLTDLGLIDEYRLYFRPFVLGGGKPYFAGARPPLRIVASDRVGDGAIRLTCAPV